MNSLDHKSMLPTKVLMVAPTSFFKDYGGHIRIYEEASTLQKLGHEVTIVTYYMGDNLPGLTIKRTKSLPYRADYEVGSSRHKIGFDLYLLRRAIEVGWQWRPHIIHGHMHEGSLIGGIVARLLGVPLVFDFQGSLTGEMVDHGFLSQDGPLFTLFRLLERTACRIPQAIITSSNQAVRLLIDNFGVDSQRIFPLPDCVDTARFNPDLFSRAEKDALRQRLEIPRGWPVVVYLGLLADYQGIPEIIRTAATLRESATDVFFLIMGFPKADMYQGMAYGLGLADRVKFTGKIEYRDAPRYLSVGDIAISAKMSSTEGSGKVLNYMAMSMPVVAFDTPVHREYLGDKGTYAPIGDTLALAKGIEELVAEPENRALRGQELRNHVMTRFSWDEAGMRIADLYKRLTEDM